MTYNDDSDALCSKRKDQLLGFWSFILLNIIVVGFAFLIDNKASFILPWIINGLVILISLGVRPHFTVGYLASLAGLIAVSLLYVASCYVACSGYDDSWTDSTITLALICPALVFPAWLILAIYQSIRLYRKACGDKAYEDEPLFHIPDYRLEESSHAERSPDEIRQQAEREWEEWESQTNKGNEL